MVSSDEKGKHPKRKGVPSKLNVRVNSEKVRALQPESLVEVEEQSEFSQWRSVHRKVEETDLPQRQDPTGTYRAPWWQRKFKRLLVLLSVFVAVVLLFIGVVFYSPLLAVRTITVEGASLIPQSAVEERLQELEGIPLTRVTDDRVKELVGYQNVLRDVTVEAQPPHGLVVRLQERVPVALVQDEDHYVLVDNEGVQLGEVSNRDDATLPLIDGGLGILGTGEFQTVTSVLAALPSSLLAQVKSTEAESASTITLVLADDVQVVWGTADDSELKAKVLIQLMDAVGGDGEVKVYDVSSPLRPTTK